MPTSPGGMCLDCNSRAVSGSKYCGRHETNNRKSQHKRDFDHYRSDDPIRKLYRTKRWKSVRLTVLRRDILCQACGHQAATVVDHILLARLIVDTYGVEAFFDLTRLQGLCAACHNSKTAVECGWSGKHN
jgi:5-methylcytosine-specific restriction endonuclease McrA